MPEKCSKCWQPIEELPARIYNRYFHFDPKKESTCYDEAIEDLLWNLGYWGLFCGI